jgi:nitrous oxide reductase
MTDTEHTHPTLQFNRRLLVGGAVLIGTGGVLGATGILVGTWAVVSAAREWMKHLEVPPGEVARQKLHQARVATSAAAAAWRHQGETSTPE